MKTLGTLLIVVGLANFFILFTGFIALMTPIDAAASSPALVASTFGATMLLLCGVGAACVIGGAVALSRCIKPSRQRKREGTKTGTRKPIWVTLVTATLLACLAFSGFKFTTRWNPDKVWAAKVIGEATELQILLAWYYEENGRYPTSLSEIDQQYTQPTDYLTRNSTAPDVDRWFYDLMKPNDYQLYVTADAWVSYHDALVYRKSGHFSEPWFDTRDAEDWRDFGRWRYVKGFSQYVKQYEFDAQRKPQQK